MRKILSILLILVSLYSSAQYSPTGTKTKFVNGIALGTKDTNTLKAAGDTIVLTVSTDSTLRFRYKGRYSMVVTRDATQIDSLAGFVQIISNTGTVRFYRPSANTDAARGTAITTAFAASDTSDVIRVGPGNYLRTTAIRPKKGQFWDLTTAVLYKTSDSFDIIVGDSISNVTIQGGKLKGTGHAYGNVAAQTDEAGIRWKLNTNGIAKGLRVINVDIQDFKGPAVYIESEIQNGDSARYINGSIEGLNISNCTYGLVRKSGYWKVYNNNMSGCDTGYYSGGANVLSAMNNVTYNRVGLYQNGGDHGIHELNNFNHNTFRQAHIKDVNFGMTFGNNHFYGAFTSSNDTLIVIENSKGVNITGGQFGAGTDGTIKISLRGATPGYNTIKDVVYIGTNPTIYGTTLQKSYLIINGTRRTDSAVSVANTATDLGISNLITSGTITATNYNGTLLTALQPNITTVGTLVGLTTSGPLSVNNGGNSASYISNNLFFNSMPQSSFLAAGYNYISIGGTSIQYRNNYDAYYGSNAQLNSAGAILAKYSYADGLGYLAFLGGRMAWFAYNGSVTAGSTYSAPAAFDVSAAGDLIISGNNATKASGTAWINPSDSSLKTEIRPYSKGLKELMLITPKVWRFNKGSGYDTTKEHLSPIAQEIKKVMPEMVSTYKGIFNGKEKKLLQVDASDMTWLHTVSIQELKKEKDAEVKNLQTQIDELKALIKVKK